MTKMMMRYRMTAVMGDGGTDGTDQVSKRGSAIKIQKNKIASLKLDIEENNLKMTKLENKVKNKLVTSKLDGTVAYIGDEATGSYKWRCFSESKKQRWFLCYRNGRRTDAGSDERRNTSSVYQL